MAMCYQNTFEICCITFKVHKYRLLGISIITELIMKIVDIPSISIYFSNKDFLIPLPFFHGVI